MQLKSKVQSLIQRWATTPGLLLTLIIFLGLALRFWGLDFGLPYRYHPDEVRLVGWPAQMLSERTLRPPWVDYPPLFIYIMMGVDAIYFLVSRLVGMDATTADFVARVAFDPTPLYLLARGVSALWGAATIGVGYAIGRQLRDRRTGLVAAFFLAVAFLHVRESHYGVADTLVTFWTALSVWGSIRVQQRGQRIDYALAAIAGGLAIASKQTVIFVLLALVAAHLLRSDIRFNSWRGLRPYTLLGALALAGGALFVGWPYLFLQLGEIFTRLFGSVTTLSEMGYTWQLDPAGGYVFYLKTFWWGLGGALCVAALLGMVWVGLRRRRDELLLLVFAIPFYLFMGWQRMYHGRYILPVVPLLCVMAAFLLSDGLSWLAEKLAIPSTSRRYLLVLGIGVLLVGGQSLINSARHGYLLTQTDTRTLAKIWIEQNTPEGARFAMEWPHHVPFLSSEERPEPDSTREYEVVWIGGGRGTGLYSHPLSYYREEGFDYLVATSNIYNIAFDDPEQEAWRRDFYAALDEELELVVEIRSYAGEEPPDYIFDEVHGPAVSLWQRERPGPVIRIYRLTP